MNSPLGLYYGVTISLVSFATGLSVVTLNLHHRGMRGQRWRTMQLFICLTNHFLRVPAKLKYFVFEILAKLVCIKLTKERTKRMSKPLLGVGEEERQSPCVFCLGVRSPEANRSNIIIFW